MCGIVGLFQKQRIDKHQIEACHLALDKLQKRGPDFNSIFASDNILLGHARLSIIDISEAGNQPMKDDLEELVIVYNGEFYNYREERTVLEKEGYSFKSHSDTEVLLYMYKFYGERFLKRINGCFALAIYNVKENILFLARDRFGIKPLYFKDDNSQFIFASEEKSLMSFSIEKTLDTEALHQYFRFNYIPTQRTALRGIQKFKPGYYSIVSEKGIEEKCYYQIPNRKEKVSISYKDAQEKLRQLMESAVQKRLVSDVPLGTFLSGGIDSSVISTVAAKHKKNIDTFSIGYEDEPLFDETKYAELVAKSIGSNHHTFRLKNKDLYTHLFDFLDALDEPFADSSALPVYILSKKTSAFVKVALSGDGADEIFSGYNKHLAHYKALNGGLKNVLIKNIGSVSRWFPQGRNGKWSNIFRQIRKYHEGLNLSDKERYLRWLSINTSDYSDQLLIESISKNQVSTYEKELTQYIKNDFDDILYSDVKFLLPNDMLNKVDKMSMANSLEVRTPFLDHEIVNFAFSLDVNYKITSNIKKRIVQDAFREMLPNELYNRPKHGFEVPLLNWFRNDLNSYLFDDVLRKDKIEKQNILNFRVIEDLKQQLFSVSPADSVASLWAIFVFQYWYDKHF